MSRVNEFISIEISKPPVLELEMSKITTVYDNNYEHLTNLPSINNKKIIGDLLSSDLKLQPSGEYLENDDFVSNQEIYNIIKGENI